MAGSVNKCLIIGNLGKDPEVRTTRDGGKFVHLSVATSENWTDKSSGERKERTDWHKVVIYDSRLAEVAERYLSKGRKVYVEGSLRNENGPTSSRVRRGTQPRLCLSASGVN